VPTKGSEANIKIFHHTFQIFVCLIIVFFNIFEDKIVVVFLNGLICDLIIVHIYLIQVQIEGGGKSVNSYFFIAEFPCSTLP